MDHPARARVAEIVVNRAGKDSTRGSGYLVRPGWVLTAHHVVRDAASVGVWLGAPSELVSDEGAGVDVGRMLTVPAADLALLPLGGQPDDRLGEPALLGRLDRDPGPPVPVAAAGCPRFKLRPAPGRPGVLLRELDYAIGSIASLSDAKTGMYEFAVEPAPGEDPEPDKHSPWEGMSGAAVWASGRLIGVVGQHHPREGLATLTVRPLEQLFGCASAAELQAWRTALPQLPATAGDLWLATPPTIRKIEVARARRAAEALAPRVLIGRSTELAALEAFTGSGTQWRWIQGDAFVGKTALLAWFALHPPERVDLVACFLRRASGDNTADYAMDVLTRQLALLADRREYLPPPFVSERTDDFVDLLDEAARACAERNRRLIVLIDGLDEYDPTTTSIDVADWLPSASTLPDQAMLLVASRAGADVRLPLTHPLVGCVQRITASEAATEIRQAAHKELDLALKASGNFIFPLISCLAVASGGLTANELHILLKRRGRDADVSEIEALLGSSLSRSLMYLPGYDGADPRVYVFAHETLLTQARAQVAADLMTYEDLFDAWANDYIQCDWPIDTPRYLLRPYTRELARRIRDLSTPGARCMKAVDQLFKVTTYRSWLLRLFERTGNPAVPDQEIVAAQHAIIDSRDRSGLDADEVMFRLAVLALRRRPLTDDRADIAASIADVWARIGRVEASFELAAGIHDPHYRVQALSNMAAALAEAGQTRDALRAVTSIDDAEQRARALRGIAATLGSAGQPRAAADAAGQVLQAATSIDDHALRAEALIEIAATLARGGQLEAAADTARRAMQAAASINNPDPRSEALRAVAAAFAETGQPEAAADAAARALQAAATTIDDPKSRAKALTGVAVALAEAGQPEAAADAARQALQAATSINNPDPRSEALRGVAAAFAETGQPEAAADAARQALQAASSIERPIPRLARLSMAAVALAEAGQHESALQAATGIDDEWWQARALSEIAATLASAGQPGAAADMARRALQAATSVDSAEWMSEIAATLAGGNQPEAAADAAQRALQAATSTDNPYQRSRALKRAAEALAMTGHPESALQAAKSIVDPKQQAQGLTLVAARLARIGQPEAAADAANQALRAATSIDNPGQWTSMLYRVAEELAEGGEAGSALQVANSIDDLAGRAWALSLIAAALARIGQPGAADTAREALQATTGINDPDQRTVLLIRVATTLAQVGQPGPALQAAASIDDPAPHVAAVISVAAGLAGAGQPEAAADAAGQGLQAAASIDDPASRVQALSWLSAALAGAGQPEAAADAAGQGLQAAASIDDPASRVQALSWLSAALAGAGQPEAAADAAGQGLQATASIDDPASRVQALSWLSAALAGAGQPEAAADAAGQGLQAAASIDDPASRVQALSWLSAALAGAGQPEAAADAAGQGLQAAASIGDPGQQTMALLEVAVALAGASEPEAALQAATSIADPAGRAYALSGIAATLARVGQLREVAHTARQALRAATSMSIGTAEEAVWVLTYVAAALAQAGEAGPALQAANSIGNAEWRTWALSGVAAILARVGPPGTADDAALQAVQTVISIDDAEQCIQVLGGLAAAVAGATSREADQAANPVLLALRADMVLNRPLYLLQNAWMAIQYGETLARIGQSRSAVDARWQALREAVNIDYLEQQILAVGPLRNSRLFSNINSQIERRALELLLFSWDASYYLAVFPAALLRRLVANGEFASVKLNPANPDGNVIT